jgi:aldose 1-epimerase
MTQITKQAWGVLPTGESVHLYTLRNSKGTEVSITDFGGRIVTLRVPDREGKFADVVLGFDSLDGYLAKNPYLGALVGRFANRIGGARFTLDGEVYELAQNNGPNALHGGLQGFDKVLWRSEEIAVNDGFGLHLQYVSKDGEEGYPGKLTVVVTYTLTESDGLQIAYNATADKATVLNLTNHSYFDLSGDFSGNILEHEATINADAYTPADAASIPTGDLQPVEGTPFDFRTRMPIGARIDADDPQLKSALGYDHNFVLRGGGGELRLAARVLEPKSGRVMDVLTTQPGVQFYTGNHLDGSVTGKGGVKYGFRHAFCMETQHFPDAPNKPQFPSTRLAPGEEFQQRTVFRFSSES